MPRVSTTSLVAARWSARAPRILVLLLVGVFSAVGVRTALRPAPTASTKPFARVTDADLAADAFAQSFVRAYLTWDGSRPTSRERALRGYLAASLDPDAGVDVPSRSRQRVRWTTVERSVPIPGGRRVTVDADTTAGETRLAVDVARDARGALSIPAYPAIVGPPATDTSSSPRIRDAVDDDALVTVARRVVANYLGRARANLAADLTGSGTVVLPSAPLRLLSVEATEWAQRPSRVAVTVHSRRQDGARLTLTYELVVVRRAGRWLVSGVQASSIPKETP